MGSLNKQVFKGFVDSECERRLFLTIGRDDDRWISPADEIKPRKFEHKQHGILELGTSYETAVYSALRAAGGFRFRTAPRGELVSTSLDPILLQKYAAELPTVGAHLGLLEHQFAVPEHFNRRVLGLSADEPVPILTPSAGMRPDILVLDAAPPCREELLPDGSTARLQDSDLRIGIRIIDIKHTAEVQVGKSHFIEILCYAHALVSFLETHQLRQCFYVPTGGHGIFPQHDLAELFGISLPRLGEYIVPLVWGDVSHLFSMVQSRIQKLREAAPAPIESTAVNIQASCGHCHFVEDCKSRLGVRDGVTPADWDVRLLPHTTNAIAQQLNAEGFSTIGDVAQRLSQHQPTGTPQPLYAESPLLMLKSHALVAAEELPATPEHTGDNRHLSMAIPRYSEIELIFNAETDPASDVVFAVGLSLSASVHESAPIADLHRRWWETWARLAQQHRQARDVPLEEVIALLSPELIQEQWAGDNDARALRQILADFATSLWALRTGAGGQLTISPDLLLEEEEQQAGLDYQFGYVNGGVDLQDERKLAEVLVERAHHIMVVASGLETLLRVPLQLDEEKTILVGPNFAGFYWSSEQLQHIQDLLERHLEALLFHARLRGPLLQLLSWLSPTDSEVSSSLQHKKLFNLRTFVETTVGLPHIINYTWHGLAEEAFGVSIDRRYWARHFNYMDFAAWHVLISERDSGERQRKHQELVSQLLLKIKSVHRLLWRYRKLGWDAIAKSSRSPVSSRDLLKSIPPDTIHPLARVWYLFSRLDGAVSILTADHARTTYPAQSIGKLVGGEVSGLEVLPEDGFRFELRGLSANMKLRERNRVLLIPEDIRDDVGWTLDKHQIEVKTLRWDAQEEAYLVEAQACRSGAHPLHADGAEIGEGPWYVYITASDIWSSRLFNARSRTADCLFRRHQLGTSWLGRRLSYLWRIGSDDGVPAPEHTSFGMPEIYLYAPEVLPRQSFDPTADLLTDAHFLPDPSQKHAIHLAMASTICCLQGPPGTGKSQTIAALIDEFLCRRAGRPARILVTAFSYAALNVVLEKVLSGQNAQGQPTRAAQLQAVFMRSGSRDPAPEVAAGRAADLVGASKSLTLDGKKLSRQGGKRLDDYLQSSFILFANAHQLYHLGGPSSSKAFDYELLGNGFGFDLIIVDEASQLPTDHFLAAVSLVKPGGASLTLRPTPQSWPVRSAEELDSLASDAPLDPDALTRVVIVGDHHQLPPVQSIRPPRKLRKVLDSLFRYYVDGHRVPSYQLRVNYRSEPQIVDYTRHLGLYEELVAFRGEHPYPVLPAVPSSIGSTWLKQILDPRMAVSALIQPRQFETAVSPIEALLTAQIAVGFFAQMGISSASEEQHFWREHLGIVSPHNAHGRLVARQIFAALTAGARTTHLSDEALMRCLDSTIYSVEKFQGSDRTFILATIGISSVDQLRAEEEFIYDLNRFNVLTSRAKQKMLLICSQNLLDYVPRDREVMANAARLRAYALEFCNQEASITVQDESGQSTPLRMRWHGDADNFLPPEEDEDPGEDVPSPPQHTPHPARKKMTLEDIQTGSNLEGIAPGQVASVIAVVPVSPDTRQVIYRLPGGSIGERLLHRSDEDSIQPASTERPWAFDGDGEQFQLAVEAKRIDLAFLFDPMMAVHASNVEPLPHQITAVYESLLPRQPLRYVLADDPGAGKTIMAGLYIRELIMRADARRILVVAPGSLVEQWRDELYEKFGLDFRVFSRELEVASASGNAFEDNNQLIARLDQLSRSEEHTRRVCEAGWDLVIFDEAHKLSAHFYGKEIKRTKRFLLAEQLGARTRHLLLMTATPHNGKEEDFQLFLSLLDGDRFYGKFRDGVHQADSSDLMRRMVKEELVRFDGTPLFPERRAYTINYVLSPAEAELYELVTSYVKTEMGKADQLDGRRKGSVGFALTTLQRRLASSPEAIYQSLRRRLERLERRLVEAREGRQVQSAWDGPPEDDDDLDALEQESLEESLVDEATASSSITELEGERLVVQMLTQKAKRVVESGRDRKWEELSRILQDDPNMRGPDGRLRKLIIFSEHRDTLRYLNGRIVGVLGRAEAVATIHGGVSRDDRRKIQAMFRSDPEVRVLVATDAAGEGVNLQNANLMVNYDLPWNPNRLEQRFGRIHRIGQTEVCHLWNLVAKQTREGAVYHRLLEKLQVESEALKGRVFDILGEVFEGVSLRELLIDAIRYGDQADVRARLHTQVEGAMDHSHLCNILDRHALAQETMSPKRLFAVKEEMEKAEARRLQPHFIRSFFLQAFTSMGGSIHRREADRMEITHVPAVIRERDRRITGRNQRDRAPVLRRYERVCFTREAIQPLDRPGRVPAVLLHPGQPLMMAVTDLLLEQSSNLLRQGAILVDPVDEGDQASLLLMLTHEIRSGNDTTLSRRLQFVRVHPDGSATFAGWAPHLDLEPLAETERPLLKALLAESWLSVDLEQRAMALAASSLVPEHHREVARRHTEQIDRTLAAVHARLSKEINFWTDRWMVLRDEAAAGKDVRLNLENTRRMVMELEGRLKGRTAALQAQRHISSATPVVLGAALVVPVGLLRKLRGEDAATVGLFAASAAARAKVERLAMDAVRRAEEARGCQVVDVSAQKCGWDISSYPPATDGRQPEARHIEVKGRVKGATTVTVTRNEILYALNQADRFVLAIVLINSDDSTEGPYYIRRPFDSEPGWGVSSINFDLAKLLARGSNAG